MKNLTSAVQINISDVDKLLLHKLAEFSGYESAEKLVQYLISSIIDGAIRPGSWERQVLYYLGIESKNDCYLNSSEQLLEHYQQESLS